MFPLDISNYLNTLMFKCTTKPGLSNVLTDLLDFEHAAIRSRRASQLRGGPNNALGFFVGKTMREAMLEHRWCNGILIGCDGSLQKEKSSLVGSDMMLSQYDARGSFLMPSGSNTCGIVGVPSKTIMEDDTLIFVSRTSNPSSVGPNADRTTSFKDLANARFDEQGVSAPFGDFGSDSSPSSQNTGRRPPPARRLSAVKSVEIAQSEERSTKQELKQHMSHIVLCGWREGKDIFLWQLPVVLREQRLILSHRPVTNLGCDILP